jgi:hypothetical protein
MIRLLFCTDKAAKIQRDGCHCITENYVPYRRFEVVKMSVSAFWVVLLHGLIGTVCSPDK